MRLPVKGRTSGVLIAVAVDEDVVEATDGVVDIPVVKGDEPGEGVEGEGGSSAVANNPRAVTTGGEGGVCL